MEHLLRYNGRSAVVLSSFQGLELKGGFMRSSMRVPGRPAGADVEEVALFLGSPRFQGFSELTVGVLADRSDLWRSILKCALC